MRYIKAAEAIKLSGLPSSTFYRFVREGRVKKYFPTEESSHGLYDQEEIVKLREEQGDRYVDMDRYETDWLTFDDLGSLYDLEYKIYEEDTGDPRIVRNWLKRTPLLGRILFNIDNRRDLWGAVLFLPIVDEDTIIKLVTQDGLDHARLNPATQIKTYDDPGVYDLYAASVIMKPGKGYLFSDLMRSYFDWWIEQAPEKKIGKIWTRTFTEQGEALAIRLQASPLDWLGPKVYRLDLSIPRRLPLLRDFQQGLKEKEAGQ